MSIKWNSIKKDGLPKEDGRYRSYMVTVKGYVEGSDYIDLVGFSNNLHKVDEYDFYDDEYKGKKGFYSYDSEYGYCEYNGVIAWAKVEPYKGE